MKISVIKTILDPQKRYELFKKMDKAIHHSTITPRKKQPDRESYFEREFYFEVFVKLMLKAIQIFITDVCFLLYIM